MSEPQPGSALPPNIGSKFRQAILGRARDVHDPTIRHQISLVAFLAWVGLGADGLSSSAYGPEEAYRALGDRTYLALALVVATAATVLIISYTYSKIIEHFPMGGGGYLVATELLGPAVGVVSGGALLVDYILTITVSIASGGDAVFSLLPESTRGMKLPVEFGAIVLLTILNLRGVKESVTALIPIFLTFIATHLILIIGAILWRAGDMPEVGRGIHEGFRSGAAEIGGLGLFLVFLRAFSLGGGTYTGIEAVSNGVGILRDPKVETGKRTMVYMAVSLAATAGGLLVCYKLADVHPVEGQTLNAVLASRFASAFTLAGLPLGKVFVYITIFSEAILLLVAAQTGFIDGPRVMANMASDSWLPRRFSSLSDRLTMQNGILLIGAAAAGLLAYTRGVIGVLVVMYSLNVFVTFSLSQMGMMRMWVAQRASQPTWLRNFFIHLVGFALCFAILVVMVKEKFAEGAWVTVLLTGTLIALCFAIRKHYRQTLLRINEVRRAFADLLPASAGAPAAAPAFDPSKQTAVILVGGYDGLGMHLLLSVFKHFPGVFHNFIFISVGVVDSAFFKDEAHVEMLEERTQAMLQKYIDFCAGMGLPARSAHRLGTDVVEEVSAMCCDLSRENPRNIFFAGELLFERPQWYHRMLHNETAYAIQRRIRFAGLSMVIMPVLLRHKIGEEAPPPPSPAAA